jgi:hypothetical protein
VAARHARGKEKKRPSPEPREGKVTAWIGFMKVKGDTSPFRYFGLGLVTGAPLSTVAPEGLIPF